jgi:hypothetical protein
MQIRLLDPAYTDRLAAYLQSLGQRPSVSGPDSLEIDGEFAEIEIYVGVWKVLYPDVEVELRASS